MSVMRHGCHGPDRKLGPGQGWLQDHSFPWSRSASRRENPLDPVDVPLPAGVQDRQCHRISCASAAGQSDKLSTGWWRSPFHPSGGCELLLLEPHRQAVIPARYGLGQSPRIAKRPTTPTISPTRRRFENFCSPFPRRIHQRLFQNAWPSSGSPGTAGLPAIGCKRRIPLTRNASPRSGCRRSATGPWFGMPMISALAHASSAKRAVRGQETSPDWLNRHGLLAAHMGHFHTAHEMPEARTHKLQHGSRCLGPYSPEP